jgi:hypothetical protein
MRSGKAPCAANTASDCTPSTPARRSASRASCRGPVLAPRPEEHPHQHAPGGPPNVVYPCGALRRGGRWLLSYGYFDREVRVTELEHAGLERALVPATFRHYHHAIDGWSADFEPLYARMVKEARDGAHFVEVGVWRGRSLSFLAMECRNAGKKHPPRRRGLLAGRPGRALDAGSRPRGRT